MTTNLPIASFSPTQTDAFSFCPRYWGFYRARLKPKCILYPEIAAIIGTAVASGLEAYYTARALGHVNDPLIPAIQKAQVQRDEALAHGLRYVAASDQIKWDAIDDNVALLLKTHAKHDPFKDYTVVEVEQTGDDHDRPDLIVRDDMGPLVVDFKCKLTLKAEWVSKEMRKWGRSWQLHHYAIRRGIGCFAVCLIAPHTRQGIHYEITQVNPHYADLWVKDAAQLWSEMDFAKGLPLDTLRGNTSHANEYGECAYWAEACSHGMDPAMLSANLVQLDPRKEPTPCPLVSSATT